MQKKKNHIQIEIPSYKKRKKEEQKERKNERVKGGRHRQTKESTDRKKFVVVVSWLLKVPATCECISGTDLLGRFYVLPH